MIKSTFLNFFITALPALFVSILSFGQSEKAEAGIRDIMHQSDVVGLSVAVVKNNKIIYTHSFGLKDAESNQPLTDDCIFRIASVSKSFSATSAMQLAEAKKLSLNDDISKLIGFRIRNPKYPEKIITLRMVLSHRSGINDSQGYFTLDVINPDKNPDWAKCYNDYEPGTGYMYCNLNYNMVGTIIEKISGERFDQYVKLHILDRLGLYGGYCVDSLDNSRFATIYEYDDSLKKFNPSPAAYAPRRAEIANYIMGYSTPIFSPTGGMKISATENVSLPFVEKQLELYDWISDDEEDKSAPVRNLEEWTGIGKEMLPPEGMLNDKQVQCLLDALKKMLDAYNWSFVLQTRVPERIQYTAIRDNFNQQAKVKRWHMGFFELCRRGTEHKKCALDEYCQCAFYAELFSGFIDEELSQEEERA